MICNQGVQRTRDNSKYAFAWDTVSMPNEGGCEFLQIPFNLDRSGVKTFEHVLEFLQPSNIVALPWAADLPHRHLLDHFLSKV